MKLSINWGFLSIGVAILLQVVILVALGNFTAVSVPDSKTYQAFDTSSLAAALSQMRTFGYPLFLKLVGDQSYVPTAHFLAFVLANILFHIGLIQVGYNIWTATWCTIAMLFGRAAIDQLMLIQADSLAISLAIAATGCFLMFVSAARRPLSWLGLSLFTFLTYQVHPSYLFLIPLWPLASWILDAFLLRRLASHREILQRTACVALLSIMPFLAFCTLRWCVVGHWGLVSFGGYNLVGVTGQFLDQRLASELPPRLQPLATEMLQRRPTVGPATTPGDFLAMETMFNPTVWDLAVPIAEQLSDRDPVRVNQLLNDLSREIIRRRPWLYGYWLIANANHARQELMLLLAFDKGITLLLVAYMFMQFISLLGGRALPQPAPRPATDPQKKSIEADRFIELQLLLWLAVLFAAARITLVILVEPAISRYMTGAMVLLPAAAAVWLPVPGVRFQFTRNAVR